MQALVNFHFNRIVTIARNVMGEDSEPCYMFEENLGELRDILLGVLGENVAGGHNSLNSYNISRTDTGVSIEHRGVTVTKDPANPGEYGALIGHEDIPGLFETWTASANNKETGFTIS